MDLGVPLESPQGSQASSQVETCTSAFLPSCNSSVWLPIELAQASAVFPRGATRQSHMPPSCESILGVTVKDVHRNHVHVEWTEKFWGLLEWWHNPCGSSRLSCLEYLLWRCKGNARNPFSKKQRKEPTSRPEELETGLHLSFGGTIGVPFEWRRVCQGTSCVAERV